MELTVPAELARAARDHGDAPAVAEPGGPRFGFRELRDRAALVGRGLIAAGIEPGDRVAIWSPNTHHWVVAALGALGAGATLVPVSTRFTGPEALDVIGRSRARVLFVAGWFLGTDRLAALARAAAATGTATAAGAAAGAGPRAALRLAVRVPVEPAPPDQPRSPGLEGPSLPGLETISWGELLERGAHITAESVSSRATTVRPGDLSDILFTSGTTGRSKGAMSTHRQALGVARAWAECTGLRAGDRYLVVNPFFHSFGYKAGILACLAAGAALVPQPVFDAEQAMRLIEAERITVLPGAPTVYQTILDHPARSRYDLSSLRLAVTGAAPVPVALVERMRRELSFDHVLTGYGLTEAVVATMCRPGDDPETVSRTSGRATAGFEVRIAAPDGPGAGAGQPGEILLRGPNVMAGYLDDPAATAAAVDPAGWLHTGDIGCLDPAGNLAITDRLKDMFVCGGFNVYPAEVEQVLARLDGVAAAAVVGVTDGRLGEVGKAFLVPRPGQVLDPDQVLAFCREQLAGYKVPRQLEFRADLPRNPAGKVLKRLLREESP